jgi:hypothetical protein
MARHGRKPAIHQQASRGLLTRLPGRQSILPPEADVSGVIALFGLGHRSDFPMTVGSNANVSSCE